VVSNVHMYQNILVGPSTATWHAQNTSTCCATTLTGVSSETNPRIVPALMLLGYVYARSARVTFAEGLLRESCKILKVRVVVRCL
jgi:hypothetical protein